MARQVAEQDLEEISKRVAKREHVDVVQTYQSMPAVQRQIVLARQRLAESFARLEQAREKLRQMSVAVKSLDTLRTLRRQEWAAQLEREFHFDQAQVLFVIGFRIDFQFAVPCCLARDKSHAALRSLKQ